MVKKKIRVLRRVVCIAKWKQFCRSPASNRNNMFTEKVRNVQIMRKDQRAYDETPRRLPNPPYSLGCDKKDM